ncbi:MAG: H-NS histone family protein [Rhodoferax sp.]|nr:H-NS histone family protein [Rhodoferax sp.]MCP5182217.1 H-NS histone family protein [Pseudomonadales bacterium]
MTNLIDIQSQIEKLQKQANDIRSKEFDKTVQEIVEKMRAFGITVKDIQAAIARPASKKPAKARRGADKAPAAKVAAKFRGPNGETWSGRGLTPRWLASLVEQGRKKEEFAIANPG